ncbi:SDR family oxidoreductase [Candidatus Saccharibacteria bacterium]|nr:SDR family oxidoreductase [Candidatus Saccharibacteria bacterium]
MGKSNYALVTGGSSGIGLAFARELAAEGWDLILASRDQDLAEIAKKLGHEFDVTVETLSVDLGKEADIKKVEKRIIDAKKPIGVLVNSAGFVLRDSLVTGNLERQRTAFKVMAEAVMILSQAAAGVMKKRGEGMIINIASTAAFFYNGNYSALKRWVMVYTEALALELRGTGVTATAVCPGNTRTNFHASGGVKRKDLPDWMWCRPEQVARSGWRAAKKSRRVHIPTVRWRLLAWTCRHFQCLPRSMSRKLVSGRTKEVEGRRDPN